MRLSSRNSVRTVALTAGFCALGVVAGCGRATFDLLSDESLVSAGQATSSSAGARSGTGGGGGSSGKAFGGAAGKADMGGFGGRFQPFPLGGGANQPCFGEGGCADEEPTPCSTTLPFCNLCRTKSDCISSGEARTCDPELKRCVQCRTSLQCNPGELCNPSTYRCAKACGGKDGCGFDGQHMFCSQELGVCVACTDDPDCNGYGPYAAHCAANVCAECSENSHCASQACKNGHCVPLVPTP